MRRKYYKKSTVTQLLFMAAVLLFLTDSAYAAKAKWKHISPVRVYDMVSEGSGLWIIDVRSPLKYKEGHIEGAVNISKSALVYKRFPKNKVLVLVDTSLGLSDAEEAALVLLKNGQERVYVLEGGVLAWRNAEYPIVGKKGNEIRVTTRELKKALEDGISLRLLDLREEAEVKDGLIAGSKTVKGEDFQVKTRKLKEILSDDKRKGLAGSFAEVDPVVLVLPSFVDGEEFFAENLFDIKSDVRYLVGGYAAWIAKSYTKTNGSCPSCSRSKERGR